MKTNDYSTGNTNIIPLERATCQEGNFKFRKQIGRTIYEVSAFFNSEAVETAEEKLFRIKNMATIITALRV